MQEDPSLGIVAVAVAEAAGNGKASMGQPTAMLRANLSAQGHD
jgi:hypothetical protein